MPDRRAETLKEAIVQHIQSGSHIIADGWADFNNEIYTHDVVIHQHPDDDTIYTRNVENLSLHSSVN